MKPYEKLLLIFWFGALASIILGVYVFPGFFLLALAGVIGGTVTFIVIFTKHLPELIADTTARKGERKAARAARKTKEDPPHEKCNLPKISELKRQYDEAQAAEAQKLAEVLARNERRMREIAGQKAAASSEDDPDADDACLQEFLDSVSALQDAVDSVNSESAADETDNRPPRKSGLGGFGIGLAIIGALLGGGNNNSHSRCDSNCDACPPHYGYRYGRWYYGHGHRYGCQRGGNGGASGRTFRD